MEYNYSIFCDKAVCVYTHVFKLLFLIQIPRSHIKFLPWH